MDLQTLQTRLVAEFAGISGVPSTSIYLGDQAGPKLPTPRIVFNFPELDPYGTRADESVSDAPSPSQGAEIVITRAQLCSIGLMIECFTSVLSGNDQAFFLLAKLQMGLTRADVRERLRVAGVSIMKLGRVLNVTSALDEPLESRATLQLELQAVLTDARPETYIEHVVVRQQGISGSVTINVVEES